MKQTYEPVSNGFASRTLLVGGVATNGAERMVHEKARNSVSVESGVKVEVLGGGVLEKRVQSNRQDERVEYELEDPFEIGHSSREKHLRIRLSFPR